MLDHEKNSRPSINIILNHPYFLEYEGFEKWIYKLNEQIFSERARFGPHFGMILDRVEQRWSQQIQRWEQSPFSKQFIASGSKSIFRLLRFLRNGLEHSKDQPIQLQQKMMASNSPTSPPFQFLNDFFMWHESISWFYPAFYRTLVQFLQEWHGNSS